MASNIRGQSVLVSKQLATNLVANIEQSIKTFHSAIQEIDISRTTLDSMFAATKQKITKKADEEIAKEAARIREEKQKLMQEAEQIYKDRVKTMQTARASNIKEMNKAKHKRDEVNQLIMDRRIKIEHHTEQLLQDLKRYSEMKSTKIPFGLTYMDFQGSQNSLGGLVLKDEQPIESATSAQTTKPQIQPQHLTQDKWRLKTKTHISLKNPPEFGLYYNAWNIAAYSNSDIVLLDCKSASLSLISESNPQSLVIPQDLPIQGLIKPISMTVNRNDELYFLDYEGVKIFNRNYQLLHQFNPGSEPSCIAVDENNLIAVGYHDKAEISLHKPDGSLIRTILAPGIRVSLNTYKQRLIYTSVNYGQWKLVSKYYNGDVVFSVDFHYHRFSTGVCCCDKDGSIYVCSAKENKDSSEDDEVHHYSPDGKFIRCIISHYTEPIDSIITPAGDLVLATYKSVHIYQHE
ncbi:uncharacterized protein LOC117300749 [Asterias rubens]|uniref:uncharacterized protein LOC117300749 n=1 Tax=Asterias rubens TaxID=7604 RepID=UPI001455639D|nr:uncharacterized protein LOC117300749 [Asterias rubens]